MKNVSQTMKRVLSFALAVMMVISMMPQITIGAKAATPDTLYLKPNSNWVQANARFAAYFFGGSDNTWVDAIDSDGDDIYEVTVPAGSWTNVIFCRMTPSSTTNNWNNKWNQTGDLVIPTDDNVLFTVPSGWDFGTTGWGPYTPPATPVEHIYTVAGEAGLCGIAWDPGYAANDMTQQSDGTYTKVYENIPAGTFEYKVARDHSWDHSWGNGTGNASVTVAEDGSTVTISYKPGASAPSATVEAPAGECAHEYEYDCSTHCMLCGQGERAANHLSDFPSFPEGKNCTTDCTVTYFCTICENNFEEEWYASDHCFGEDGYCTLCFEKSPESECEHAEHDQDGYCTDCSAPVAHSYDNFTGLCDCGAAESWTTLTLDVSAIEDSYEYTAYFGTATEDHSFAFTTAAGDGIYTCEVPTRAYETGSIQLRDTKNNVLSFTTFGANANGNYLRATGERDSDGSLVLVNTPAVDDDEETVNVSFATGEGSHVDSQTLNVGDKVQKPTVDPTREGYDFGGWYTNEACTEEFDFDTAVTADLTLYAKWVQKTEDSDCEHTEHDQDGYCTACGDEVGHNENSFVEKTKAYCYTPGYDKYKCPDCGAEWKYIHTDANGHNFVDGKCTNCGNPEIVFVVNKSGATVDVVTHGHNPDGLIEVGSMELENGWIIEQGNVHNYDYLVFEVGGEKIDVPTDGNYVLVLTADGHYWDVDKHQVHNQDGTCLICYNEDLVIEHTYVDGVCECGKTEPTEPEAQTITVYFRNDWMWTEVSCYAFDSSDKYVSDPWPGTPMTVDGTDGDYDVYKAEIPANAVGIIFNGIKDDGSALDQTPDIREGIADGAAWYIHWDGGNKASKFEYTPASGGEEEPGEEVSYEATFHFVNRQNWSAVNLYTWIGTGTQLTGGWPGSAVPVKNGYNTATVTYEAAEGTPLNFIFNNGSVQTLDLKLPASEFTKNEDGVYTAEKWVVLTTQVEGKYNAAMTNSPEGIVNSPVVDGSSVTFNYGDKNAAEVYVAGSFNNWSDTATPMIKNAEGIWTATVENLPAGDYQYKFVVDGSWIIDPMNGNVVTEADDNQNSLFYILSDADVEDDNTITINIHYKRTDSNYANWNLWVWGSALGGHQVDFEETDSDGAQVATIVLTNAREHQSVSFKERKSLEGNEWAAEGSQHNIDLSTIVSGTIDYYIPSDSVVYGDDVIRKNKISSVELDYDNGVITVTSVQAIPNAENALKLMQMIPESEEGAYEVEATLTTVGSRYSLELPAGMELSLSELHQYYVDYYGDIYYISIDAAYASDRFAEEYTYDGSDLGATINGNTTTFKVWAPTAETVFVNLYTSGTAGTDDLIDSILMDGGSKDEKGVWTAVVDENLHGGYYTYEVYVGGEVNEAVDPYARTTGVNGNRGMVIDLDSTDPAGWANDRNPNPASSQTDAIIYELHVRDFSIDSTSGVSAANRGKYLAFTEEGTTVPGTSISTGVDYLADMGFTHLHLLPVYDYGSVDETKCTNFNWGYDPVNYNVPEGSYSTDPYNGEVRVNEFKQMVMSLHNNGISVVMDVVYNHVYNADKFCYNNIVPGYFSRVDSNTSGCGNDTASEREMIRKYIVESVLYWAEEYHIDGFRFDLVGLLDVETINEIVTEVHKIRPDVIFYGEGWDMDSTNKEPGTQMAKQGNASKTPGFAYFSDSMRNKLAGDNGKSTGFASGAGNGAEMVSEWMANPWWTTNPQQVVQYVSCHDNYTLADKLIISTKASGVTSDIIRMNNLAAAFYMTSQGISFIHAGEELLREKLNSDGSRNHNSYNSPDEVNKIVWTDVEKYADNVEYYQGLIAFRKAHPALRYGTAANVKASVQTYTSSANLLAMRVDGYTAGDDDIFVIFNANKSAQSVTLPDGQWTININGSKAGTASLGTATGTVSVEGISAMVLTKADEGKDEAAPVGPSEQKTVYFTNNKGWSKVYAYAWTDNGTSYLLGAWPGTEATFYKNNDYGQAVYQISLPASETGIEGLIFHSNTGDQTEDIRPGVDGTGYYPQDEKNAEGTWPVGSWTERAPIVGGADDYYLHGWINNADYVGADYKFGEDGKLTVTFAADSYVYVVNGDASATYMTDGYLGAVTSGILKDTAKHTLTGTKWDKLLIPGGDEVVITLVKNDDNTVTLSYQVASSSAFEDKSGVQQGVTLHAWNWSFNEIKANMATIASQGYTAVQTSPIQPLKEATAGKAVGTNWWVYYQPVDFCITTAEGNALGTKTEFAAMCAEAEKYGIKVIVDVVANHLGNETGNDLSTAIPASIRNNDAYWHDITTDITDWSDRYDMTQHCMGGLPDLNTANDDIQQMVLDFLKECVDAGADGFRFDAAKSIETPKDDATFASDFWPTVVGGIQEYAGGDLYIYGEILDDAVVSISAYTEYMSVTDNGWGNHMRSLIDEGKAALASGFYKSTPASNLVIWAESHDTYATDDVNQSSAGVSEADIIKTWALVAARKDAMGLYFARPTSNEQLLGVASETGWASKAVQTANKFHNNFAGASETVGNSGNFAYVVRGDSGIVIVNAAGTTADVNLTVAMADGTYADQITGNTFTVAGGKITGKIGDTGIAVVREAAEIEKFEFYGTNLNLGNDLDLKFAFLDSHVEDWTGYYVEMVRTYGNGQADHVVRVESADWIKQGKYNIVVYEGFAAKEMCDDVTVTVYDPNGNAVSESKTDSIQDYAKRAFDDEPAVRTAAVDLLNYGAAAQVRFGYCDAIELANAILSAEDQQYATSELREITDIQVIEKDKVAGANVNIKSNITFGVAFRNITEGMYATVEYTGHKDNTVTETHTFEDMEVNVNDIGTVFHVVNIKSMVVSDARCKVTVTMYNADGTVYTTYVDDMASYALRGMNGTNWGVFEAFMKFADSAHAYLHRNDNK